MNLENEAKQARRFIPTDYKGKLFTTEWRLGDKIERLVKPIAKAIKSPCLDKDGNLKTDSRCRKIRDKLNKL